MITDGVDVLKNADVDLDGRALIVHSVSRILAVFMDLALNRGRATVNRDGAALNVMNN